MMKNISPKAKIKGKGMMIAILFGLLAIGTATIIGVKDTESRLKQDETPSNVIDQTASIPDESEAWKDAASDDEADHTETMTALTDKEKQEDKESKDDSKEETKQEAKTNTLTGFLIPVTGEVINPYSDGEMVKSLTLNDWRTHDGVDIAAEASTPVKACNAGKVESIENDPLWGMTVILAHPDGSKSYYMGLAKNISVNKGQSVALGEVIGSVGNTAEIEQALPSHLHFAMKKDSNWIDPLGGQAADK